jgi:hypothetical protein
LGWSTLETKESHAVTLTASTSTAASAEILLSVVRYVLIIEF